MDLSHLAHLERAAAAHAAATVPAQGRDEPQRGITLHWAQHLDEVREAQRLRYRVFAGEMGARLQSPLPGHDMDLFDDYCEHLLVRDGNGAVVGTYRLLTPAQALRAGSTYSDTEFDLTRLRGVRAHMVELGRSCVDPEYRQGGVIMALWGGLFDFMARNRLSIMVGCASIPLMHQGVFCGGVAASIWRRLRATHLAPIEYHVRPRLPLPLDAFDDRLDAEPPALIQAYLRLGARVMGPPAWDPDFGTADLPLIMRVADLAPRYRRHFQGR